MVGSVGPVSGVLHTVLSGPSIHCFLVCGMYSDADCWAALKGLCWGWARVSRAMSFLRGRGLQSLGCMKRGG